MRLQLHPEHIFGLHALREGGEELDGVLDVVEMGHFDDAVHVAQRQ